MHALLIHQAFATPAEAGGTRHYEIGRHFVNSGHRFTAITSHINYQTREEWQVDDTGTLGGIEVSRVWSIASVGGGFVNRLLAFVSFMVSAIIAGVGVRRVDLVWGTSPPIFQALGAYFVARLTRVPFVLEIRDLWPDFAVVTGVLRNPVLIFVSRRLERFLYRSADLLIVNSPAYVDWVIDRDAAPQKVVLIPNGVDVSSFDGGNGADAREAMDIGDEFIVMYAGAHGLANHLDLLLDAADRLSDRDDILIVLVGDGRDRLRLMQRVTTEGLTNVRMIPAVSKAEMPDYLAAADICIAALEPVPLFDMTYPNKIFDYMAAGRPTVLAIDGVIRDVIEEASAGTFVRPDDPDGVAAAIARYEGDRDICLSEGENARRFVKERFDRREQAELAETVFRRVLRDNVMTGLVGRLTKRTLDLVGATLALIVLAVPFLLTVLAIKIDSHGPVFFRQERVGRHGRLFSPWKFRSMVNHASESGLGLNVEQRDPRITRVGRVLRALSVDELPQIFDVLIGRMSLVGPRPTLPYQVERYTEEQRRRLLAKPGITGLAAISGRNAISWVERIQLDINYIDRWSLWSDIKIILLTPWAAWVSRKGIYGEGGVNDDFGGTPE
jgi:lipopolysaccharide/colanic/teichoic acid biosynthesis glycosyltransferase